MPRILVDLERTKYPHSGVGFFASCLKRGFDEYLADNPSIGLLDYYTPSSPHREANCRRHYGWHRLLNPLTWGYDLVHITHQLQTYFPSIPCSTRVVLTLHDLNFLYETLSPKQRMRRLKVVRKNIERADLIVCISHFVAKSLEEHKALFRLKANCRIVVVYNGISFDEGLEQKPAQLNLLAGAKYLLSIGVLQEKKQQHRLVEMFAHLPQDLHLVLVYSDANEYEEQIRKAITDLHLESRVHFLKRISSEEKRYLLEHCYAYTQPSIAEGFGIPPIEAMYYGRPVFLSTYTSLPEIGGSEAYYFESLEAEAMAKIFVRGMQDFEQEPSKSASLHQWAKRYHYRRMSAEYYALYLEVLGETR